MHTLSFDMETEQCLFELAKARGINPDELIREAVAEYVSEAADARQAEEAYQRYLRGEEGTVSLDELERGLDLDS